MKLRDAIPAINKIAEKAALGQLRAYFRSIADNQPIPRHRVIYWRIRHRLQDTFEAVVLRDRFSWLQLCGAAMLGFGVRGLLY